MNRKNRKNSKKLIAALAFTAACGGFAQEAQACGGGWFPEAGPVEVDHRPFGIAMAEKQMQNGDYDSAAATVLRVIPHIQNYESTVKDPIINRGMRVLALAAARTGGEVDIANKIDRRLKRKLGISGDNKAEIPMAWAVSALQSIADGKTDDAIAQAELGEAMAKSESHEAAGRELLEKLADKDVLTSAEAYKALAELRADAGNEDGRVAALARCKAMAKDAAVCEMGSRDVG
jgi:hypothetical protein